MSGMRDYPGGDEWVFWEEFVLEAYAVLLWKGEVQLHCRLLLPLQGFEDLGDRVVLGLEDAYHLVESRHYSRSTRWVHSSVFAVVVVGSEYLAQPENILLRASSFAAHRTTSQLMLQLQVQQHPSSLCP